MKALTKRQQQVLAHVYECVHQEGLPPTIREIGNALGIKSTNGVNDHLKALEKKGCLVRGGSKSRALQVTEVGMRALGVSSASHGEAANDNVVEIPLLGRIAAGQPIESLEHREDTLLLEPSMFPSAGRRRVFALRVQGESMIGDGIMDGDVVFVAEQPNARDGEMVAVMVDGSATVKRFYHEGNAVRLEPSNALMEPIYVYEDDSRPLTILGKIVGVFRHY